MLKFGKITAILLALTLFAGCAATLADEAVPLGPNGKTGRSSLHPSAGLSDNSAQKTPVSPEPDKTESADKLSRQTVRNEYAVIDCSDTSEGFVRVKFTAETDKRLKAQVKGPATTYTYNITAGEWAVFPLSEGDGQYKISIYENAYDSKYAHILSAHCDVVLESEFAPFLHSNQYVDYAAAPETVAKAEALTEGISGELEMVEAVYNFTVDHLSYDTRLAATVKSGYLPVLDEVLAAGKGICFDYAALMTGMLRSRGVPCKLVVGYAGGVYHAWISVWTAEEGWIDGLIFFDGSSWHRMDPTFASGADSSEDIMQYIGTGSNYVEKYIY